MKARKQVFKTIVFNHQQKVFFVGVGTGANLELINDSALEITAIDFSTHMLEKVKTKFENSSIQFFEMDAQNLSFKDDSFDYVFASLVLSVVPDSNQCLQEMTRVLKQEGTIIVFDKFAPKHKKFSVFKRFIRAIIIILGTHIGRSFDDLLETNYRPTVKEDTPIMLNGMYRKIVFGKRV